MNLLYNINWESEKTNVRTFSFYTLCELQEEMKEVHKLKRLTVFKIEVTLYTRVDGKNRVVIFCVTVVNILFERDGVFQ